MALYLTREKAEGFIIRDPSGKEICSVYVRSWLVDKAVQEVELGIRLLPEYTVLRDELEGRRVYDEVHRRKA